MNDIEVLEWFLRVCNEDLYTEISIRCDGRMRKAIENLLKERQSDKAKIMHYEKLITNGLASKEITKLNEELLAEVQTNYIPKSKIREMLEELKERADEDNLDDFIRIQVLEELLKGE